MLKIHDVMTAKVFTLDPEMTLRSAVEQLAAQRVTGAPVVAAGKVVGTLSANDVVSFVAATPGVPTQRDTPEPLSGSMDPCDEGEAPPATYFTDYWDDAGADTVERFKTVESPEWDMLDDHTVAEAMSTRVLVLPPSATLRSAAERMERAGVHRVLVADHGTLLGIVTTMDVTRAFAGHAQGRT
jgi:predicted transcriptional regulator